MLVVSKKGGKESPGPQVHSTNLFFTVCFNKKAYFIPSYFFSFLAAFNLLPLSLPNVVLFPPVIILLKPEKNGWNKEQSLTLWNIFMICCHSSFSSLKSHPFFLQKPCSHPCFPLILTQFVLCSLSHKSWCSFHLLSLPCRQFLLHLFFPSGFSSCPLQICSPCSHQDDELRSGSAGTSPHRELCEGSEGKGEGSRDLRGSLQLPGISGV